VSKQILKVLILIFLSVFLLSSCFHGIFFSVNVVARKANRNRPETNPYMQKFLKKASWKPQALAVFAGKIEYQKYKFLDRMMIRFIMWMTDGPTAPDTNIEFTDWQQVERFGQMIANSNLSRNA